MVERVFQQFCLFEIVCVFKKQILSKTYTKKIQKKVENEKQKLRKFIANKNLPKKNTFQTHLGSDKLGLLPIIFFEI